VGEAAAAGVPEGEGRGTAGVAGGGRVNFKRDCNGAKGWHTLPLRARRLRDDAPCRGLRWRKVTLVMTDLRGYISMSGRLALEQVMAMVNRYLVTMVEVIQTYQGTIFLPERTVALVSLPQAIPLQFTVLEGKQMGDTLFTGRLVKLSAKDGEVRSETIPLSPGTLGVS
jgi:hypothetical protein